MPPIWLLFLAALLMQACALVDSDPRGDWGYFENGRSIPTTEHRLKSAPWGSL